MDDIIFFDHNHKSSVLLIFFFHAILFSILLIKNGIQENNKHSIWLATFLFLGGLYISPFMLGYGGWYAVKSYRELLFFAPLQQLFLIGPVFFFSVKTLLQRDLKFSRKDFFHFLPATAYLIYSLVVFVTDKLVLDEFYFYADQKDKDLDFWYQMTGLISMLSYLILSLKVYSNYRKQSVQELSYADEVAHKWIKHFTTAFTLVLAFRVLLFILNPEWGEFGSKYWYYLCFSILLLYISIAGYSSIIKTAIHFYPTTIAEVNSVPTIDQETINKTATEHELADPHLKQDIVRAFEEHEIYKRQDLTITYLAQFLNTNRNSISRLINQEFAMNFNDFVNQKRTEAVVLKLNQKEHINTTLLGIALDCGFNSKTTFNRAFKKHMGETPKQFITQNGL